MSTLYELTGQFLDIYNMDIDDETKQDTLDAIDWQENFEEKVFGYAKVIKNLEDDIAVIKQEESRLAERRKSIKSKVDTLKTNLQAAIEVSNNLKVDSPLMTVSVRKTKSKVEVDEAKLPKKYWVKKVTESPDKKGLYDLLSGGNKIKGASLQENRTLSIR